MLMLGYPHRASRSLPLRCARTLTLREGGGRPQGSPLRFGDDEGGLVVFGGAGAAHYVADAGH